MMSSPNTATSSSWLPDLSNETEELISEGDESFARLTHRGMHRGEILGIEPTGKFVQDAGAAEVWVLGDLFGLMSQTGLKLHFSR